ncbi:TPA: hypothetical protein H7C79_002633 [Escherichia coli]|nr:hypothetical protein [Escherichia coli]
MRFEGNASTRKSIQQRLKQASDARAQEVAGSEVLYSGDANLTDEQIAKLPFALYFSTETGGKSEITTY